MRFLDPVKQICWSVLTKSKYIRKKLNYGSKTYERETIQIT